MSKAQEFRFSMTAFTPDSIPMARLAEYMEQLALLLGEMEAVHFDRLEANCTTIIARVERKALPAVRERVKQVRQGKADPQTTRCYQKLSEMVRKDGGTAVFWEGAKRKIAEFPTVAPIFNLIVQDGTLQGELVRVGGTQEVVPILLADGDKNYSQCYAPRSLAKTLGNHLFEVLRLSGKGKWRRNEDGTWELERFDIKSFELLDDRPLSKAVADLRDIAGDQWGDDPLEELRKIRYGGSRR